MKQILIIHGGNSFDTYEEYFEDLKSSTLEYERMKPSKGWKDTLVETIKDADVLMPSMPNSSNAQYDEWRILFEKVLPYLKNDVRIVGHSLGAMFIAKYLHDNPLKKRVEQLHLVAGGYNEAAEGYGSFRVESAKGLEKSAHEIYMYHSEDDLVVPYEALDKYAKDLPSAHVYRFKDRNHFFDADFPELFALLQK